SRALLPLGPETGFFGFWRRYPGLTEIVDDAVIYVAASALLPTMLDRARLFIVCLSAAGVVVFYMFVQKAGLDPVTYTTGRQIVPPGTFGQPDVAGAYVAIAGSAAAALAVWTRSPRMRITAVTFGVTAL